MLGEIFMEGAWFWKAPIAEHLNFTHNIHVHIAGTGRAVLTHTIHAA